MRYYGRLNIAALLTINAIIKRVRMTQSKVTFEMVEKAVGQLIAEGKSVILQNVSDKTGCSDNTLIPLLRRIEAVTPKIPHDSDDRLRPIMVASADVVKIATEMVTSGLIAKSEEMEAMIEDFRKLLSNAEAVANEAKAEIEKKDAKISKLEAANEHLKVTLETLKSKNDLAKAEQIKAEVHEEDCRIAKAEADSARAEAAEAREKALRLEGLLEGLELGRNKVKPERPRKEATAKIAKL
jgi:hypothetical protein